MFIYMHIYVRHKCVKFLLDVVEVSIRPVEFVIGVVNGETVWPLDLSRDDGRLVISIHSHTTDESFISPIAPVHIPAQTSHYITKLK